MLSKASILWVLTTFSTSLKHENWQFDSKCYPKFEGFNQYVPVVVQTFVVTLF